ncbi:MAG: mycofactocin biosynthesis glycosyltransferase MftF, partial [Ilumatobacteraceae bacterium]
MNVTTHHSQFVVDASWRRTADGRVVFGGSPIRMFRLGQTGAKVTDLIEHGQRLPEGHEQLTDRLLDAGAIHPLIDSHAELPYRLGDVTVVIPAFVRSAIEASRLGKLVRQCDGVAEVIVVDDGSPHALPTIDKATVVTLGTNSGPSSARNAGLSRVATPLVAFIDLDVTLHGATLQGLIPYFADQRLGIVAPRVTSADVTTTIDKYEQARSPLDLGSNEARIAPGTRVSYVPAALWLCRTDAIRAVHGFDESLRFGEDVDALWRVIDAGWRCRYQPQVTVCHRPRATLQDFFTQRRMYGRSAAELASRHPGSVAPVRVSWHSAGMWILIACGFPILGGILGTYTVLALRRKLRDVPNSLDESIRLAGLGNLHGARILASAITR